MNITQLKYVLEIAGSSSMREAASKLYVTQPALSASVRELEEELGILIFERTNKGISLTGEGREFLVYAKKAVGQYEILEDRYFSNDIDKEHFSVSTQHYAFATKAFIDLLNSESSQNYEFYFRECKTHEIIDDVFNKKSQIGIIFLSDSTSRYLTRLLQSKDNELFSRLWNGWYKTPGYFASAMNALRSSYAPPVSQGVG